MSDGNHGNQCFHNNSNTSGNQATLTEPSTCNVAMDTPVLEFSRGCIVPASNYTFGLTLHKPGRENGTAFQTIILAQDGHKILK